MDDRKRCSWIDSDGVRCPADASVSHGTRGDAGYCSSHASCSDRLRGDRIVEQHVMDGITKRLTPHERRALMRRMAQDDGPPAFDVGAMVRSREAANAKRAKVVYEAEFRVAIQRGGSTESAHQNALAALYRVARRDALGMAPPPLVGADRRAGEGGE